MVIEVNVIPNSFLLQVVKNVNVIKADRCRLRRPESVRDDCLGN